MLRSILAVLAGVAIMFVAVMVGNLVAAAVLLDSGTTPVDVSVVPLPAAYLVANVVIALLAAVLGGYTTARMVGPRSLPHVLVLAGLVVALGFVSALMSDGMGQPRWYPYVIPIIGIVGVLAGGHLGSIHSAVSRAVSTSS